MNFSLNTGLLLAIACVVLQAIFGLYFKFVASVDVHPILFVSSSMLFASATLLLSGGAVVLAKKAMTSPYTWLFAIMFILDCVFFLYLLKYISATEVSLLSRASVLFSLIFAFIFLQRNTLGRGAWGIPLIISGLAIIFGGIQENIIEIILLTLGLAIAKSTYYFAIELNKVGYETRSYVQDFSILGYILAITSIIFCSSLFIGSAICYLLDTKSNLFPNITQFSDWKLFALASFYGVFGVTVMRYLEFKSVQSIKSEVFMCINLLAPFITLLLEGFLTHHQLFNMNISIEFPILAANVGIIIGGGIVIWRRYTDPNLYQRTDVRRIRDTVISTVIFCRDDYQKASNALGITLNTLHDILDDKNHNMQISKDMAKSIRENFADNISMSDPLTGLANRLQFLTQLKSIDKGNRLTLFFIDLDKFKPINDTYGHDAGDKVLVGTAKRLVDFTGEDGLVTRLGGDEFCILLRDLEDDEIKEKSKEIGDIIAEPYQIEETENEVGVTASIGFASFPDDTNRPEALIHIADKNMYKDKSTNRELNTTPLRQP